MNSLKKLFYFKTIALTGFIFAISLFGFKAASGYGGGGGVSSTAPKIVTAINYPMTLSSQQEGAATNNFGEQGTVKLEIPKETVAANTRATFKIQMSAASANQKPDGDAFIIGSKIFSITAKDEDNNAITAFSKDMVITIILPDMPGDISGVDVYCFKSETNEWVKIPGADFDSTNGKVTFSVNHLSIFAVMYGNSQNSVSLAKEQQKKVKSEIKKEVKAGDDEFEVSTASEAGFYADGALIRGNNKKIYIINNGVKEHINTLQKLRKYACQPITDVDDEILAQYGGTGMLGAEYGNGALIRSRNMKVYVIVNGVKQHISTLQELRKYAGQPITDVDDEILAQYGGASILGEKYGNGALLRGKNFKTYVIVNGKKKHIVSLEELKNYAGQLINNVDDSILEQY
ncbi:hypothetical protein KAI65_00150 [Candidatus Parcubacteria bacterium]|nr:hypothetical protein [Candidatus Parcubacteria bacterium]